MDEYDGKQFVGIDLHRQRSVIVRQSESGEQLSAVRIINDPVALGLEIERAGPNPEVVLEATYGWYWAVDTLQAAGAHVHLAHPLGVKGFRYRRVKNDVRDAADLADLLRMNRLPEAWIAPPAIRELRDLTRYRKRLVQAHTSEGQRIAKTLEDAGIKLGSVASTVLGVSGRQMLRALCDGERDPEVLAELAKGTLRKKIPELRQALRGRFREHHALIIGLSLDHLAHLERHAHVGRRDPEQLLRVVRRRLGRTRRARSELVPVEVPDDVASDAQRVGLVGPRRQDVANECPLEELVPVADRLAIVGHEPHGESMGQRHLSRGPSRGVFDRQQVPHGVAGKAFGALATCFDGSGVFAGATVFTAAGGSSATGAGGVTFDGSPPLPPSARMRRASRSRWASSRWPTP